VILVVDDDRSMRASTLRLFGARGYTTIEAANAAEAVQKAALMPDVILMDLHLRHGTGLEAARQIKAQPSLAHIPIIALTATPPDWDGTQALYAAVLVKPCPTAQILDAVAAAAPA
jgi:CheY-like chemotaxis protein